MDNTNLRPSKDGSLAAVSPQTAQDRGEIEIDLIELFYRILENVKYIIMAALLGAVLMFAYTVTMVTPMYRTTSKLYVLSTSSSVINLQDLQIGANLAADYQEVFDNWNLHELAIQELEKYGRYYTYTEISNKISVSSPSSTRVLYITATSDDPDEVKLLADTYANVAREFIATRMDTKEPNIFQYALRPSAPYSPNRTRNTALGFILGALIAVAFITLRYVMDDKIHSTEDIEKHLGIPSLGVMPLSKSKSRSSQKRSSRGEGRSA